jgi:hypothetical protein
MLEEQKKNAGNSAVVSCAQVYSEACSYKIATLLT